MHSSRVASQITAIALFLLLANITQAQPIYKWTDTSGRVHYDQKKPEDTSQVQTLDVTPSSPAAPASSADSTAEIARLNALSEQMARERQAAEQARQEQAIRDLEEENQRLKKDLLNKQLQQQNDDNNNDNSVILYPPPYPYYQPYPPKPYPSHPCQPWPACNGTLPSPRSEVQPTKPASTTSKLLFNPKPVGAGSGSRNTFRDR